VKKLFIVILNFNGGKEILACLQSLQLVKVPVGWQQVFFRSKKMDEVYQKLL